MGVDDGPVVVAAATARSVVAAAAAPLMMIDEATAAARPMMITTSVSPFVHDDYRNIANHEHHPEPSIPSPPCSPTTLIFSPHTTLSSMHSLRRQRSRSVSKHVSPQHQQQQQQEQQQQQQQQPPSTTTSGRLLSRSTSMSTVKTSTTTIMVLGENDVTIDDLMAFLKFADGDPRRALVERSNTMKSQASAATGRRRPRAASHGSRRRGRRGRSGTRDDEHSRTRERKDNSVAAGSVATTHHTSGWGGNVTRTPARASSMRSDSFQPRTEALRIMARLFDKTGVFAEEIEEGLSATESDLFPSLADLASPFNINVDISLTDPSLSANQEWDHTDVDDDTRRRRRRRSLYSSQIFTTTPVLMKPSSKPRSTLSAVLSFVLPCFFSSDDDSEHHDDGEPPAGFVPLQYPYAPVASWVAPPDARYVGGRLWSGRTLSEEEKSRRRTEPPTFSLDSLVADDDRQETVVRLTLTPRMIRGGVGIILADDDAAAAAGSGYCSTEDEDCDEPFECRDDELPCPLEPTATSDATPAGPMDFERLSPVDTLVDGQHHILRLGAPHQQHIEELVMI